MFLRRGNPQFTNHAAIEPRLLRRSPSRELSKSSGSRLQSMRLLRGYETGFFGTKIESMFPQNCLKHLDSKSTLISDPPPKSVAIVVVV